MATEQEKNRRVAEQLRLIDDDFLRLYFNDNPEGVEYLEHFAGAARLEGAAQ